MNLGSLIIILFLSLAFEFIYSRMSEAVKGKKPVKGSRGRPVRREGTRRQVQERTVENRTSTGGEPVKNTRQSREAAGIKERPADQPGGRREEFKPPSGEEQDNIYSGIGSDFLDEDSLVKGIIISEILQPPLSRRQDRKGPLR